MKTIYKYPVPIEDEFTLSLPKGAQVLTVQMQDGKPFVWALVDTDRHTEARRFRLAGTGHPLQLGEYVPWGYIGTVMMKEGRLVFHLFEEVTA